MDVDRALEAARMTLIPADVIGADQVMIRTEELRALVDAIERLLGQEQERTWRQ